ncbi:MAG: hypothetical protein ACI9ES_002651 [Oceanospirillaceae bacterium]|jgi:hypothetical protein
MNRKKKLNQIFNRRLKKAKAKLNPSQKGQYVAKADREITDVTDVSEQAQVAAEKS